MTVETPISMSRRNALTGGLLLAIFALAAFRRPKSSSPRLSDPEFQALFPLKFGDWHFVSDSGLVLPPQDELTSALYEQLLTRIYARADGTRVMFLLAYSSMQGGRISVHRPEICYPAAGYAIVENVPHRIAVSEAFSLPTRFLVAQQHALQECMIYWTRVGSAFPARWLDQRLTLARENIEGRIPDGLLARISMLGADPASATEILDGFAIDLIKSIGPQARRVLLG